jgi:hypothetical protein
MRVAAWAGSICPYLKIFVAMDCSGIHVRRTVQCTGSGIRPIALNSSEHAQSINSISTLEYEGRTSYEAMDAVLVTAAEYRTGLERPSKETASASG